MEIVQKDEFNIVSNFLDTASVEKMREFAEKLGIVNDDHSFDEFLSFIWKLVDKREKQV